jgi:hypothetical protein
VYAVVIPLYVPRMSALHDTHICSKWRDGGHVSGIRRFFRLRFTVRVPCTGVRRRCGHFNIATDDLKTHLSQDGVIGGPGSSLSVRFMAIPSGLLAHLSIAVELTAASVLLNFWTGALQAWQWAIIIVVPVFALQLIHVRVYGKARSPPASLSVY